MQVLERRGFAVRVLVQAVVVVAALAVVAPASQAQARATPLQTMSQEAKVSKEQARMTALSKVPGGRMSTLELRRGIGGKLQYTAVIAEPGKTQKTEVVIDAMTGVVLSKRP